MRQLTLAGFEPAWERPRPAVLTPTFGELQWLQLPLGQELLWDSTMGEDIGKAQVGTVLGGDAIGIGTRVWVG